MDEPTKAAHRILSGTGFGLILLCGFAIIEERMSLAEIGIGHIFLILAVICLAAARLLQSQNPVLEGLFPNETEAELKTRVRKEINQLSHENRVGTAWAELESKVLSNEIESEE